MKYLFKLVKILSWNFICSLIGVFATLLAIGIISDKLEKKGAKDEEKTY